MIVCPAREIAAYSYPDEWNLPLQTGPILLLSAFGSERRLTTALGEKRNALVATLADELLAIHTAEGSKTSVLVALAHKEGKKVTRLS